MAAKKKAAKKVAPKTKKRKYVRKPKKPDVCSPPKGPVYYRVLGSGYLHRNTQAKGPSHPQYRGKVFINDKEILVGLWVNLDPETGDKYLRVQLSQMVEGIDF